MALRIRLLRYLHHRLAFMVDLNMCMLGIYAPSVAFFAQLRIAVYLVAYYKSTGY